MVSSSGGVSLGCMEDLRSSVTSAATEAATAVEAALWRDQVEGLHSFLREGGVSAATMAEDCFRAGGLAMMAYAASRIGTDATGHRNPTGYEQVALDRARMSSRLWAQATLLG